VLVNLSDLHRTNEPFPYTRYTTTNDLHITSHGLSLKYPPKQKSSNEMCVDCVFPMHNSMLVINILFFHSPFVRRALITFDYVFMFPYISFLHSITACIPVTLLNPIKKKKEEKSVAVDV